MRCEPVKTTRDLHIAKKSSKKSHSSSCMMNIYHLIISFNAFCITSLSSELDVFANVILGNKACNNKRLVSFLSQLQQFELLN
jgi:hypothetical protein